MATFAELREALSPDIHERGRQFEHICKWLLETDPRYSGRLTRVWLWDDWPGQWGPDCGIDLVAEDRDGKTWAIQAKCYGEQQSITRRDVDTFLVASSAGDFNYRLLIATTDKIGRNARNVIRRVDNAAPFSELLLAGLEAARVVWPSHPDRLTTGEATKPQVPRPHQKRAIRDVVDNLGGRGQLVMACGTGKTLAALRIAEGLEAKRTLVLVPSLTLLSQTITDWLANTNRQIAYLPVCSDESVDRGVDAATTFTSDLAFPVTTDPDEIAAFLRKHGPRVVFSTYQSSPRVKRAQESSRVPAFDLVIADEAHRCAGVVAPGYGTVLDDEEIRARKRLFMTATPRTYTARVQTKADDAGIEVASMDDEAVFGPVVHRLSFSEAIRKNLLSDYRVVVVGVDDPTYRQMVDQRRIVRTDTDVNTDAKTLARHVAIAKAIRDWGLRRTITFHSRIKDAKDFANTLPRVVSWMPPRHRPDVELVCDHVSGEMSTGERNRRLNRLRNVQPGQSGLLANARCLSEGIDVPSLDGVAFVDPRRSEVDIVQAVGRAIRLSDDKDTGTIIVPVFISNTDDPDEVLRGSEFAPVWSVIRALRSHDNEIGQALDAIRTHLGRTGSASELPPKIHLDLPGDLPLEFVDAIKTRLVEVSTSNWDFDYGLLQRYVEREGHARVPKGHKEDFDGEDYSLGAWCGTNRYLARYDNLPEERIEALDALGFDWDPNETSYQRRFAALAQYMEREGHVRVPQGHKEVFDGEELKLNVWVVGQRESRRNDELSQERIDALDALGFDWDPLETAFQRGRAALAQYVEREGHARVPKGHKEVFDGEELKLNVWVAGQRESRRNDGLSQERIDALDALGFDWDPLETDFQRGLAALAQYVEREGHVRVPQDHKEVFDGEDHALGGWCNGRRQLLKRGELSQERIDALDALGFDWNPTETSYQNGLAALAQFVGREGHARVPNGHMEVFDGEDYALGTWVGNKRFVGNSGGLSDDVVADLDALGFDWDPNETERWILWRTYLAGLAEFVEREGHARVPLIHEERTGGKRDALAQWVGKQRTARQRGKLPREMIDELDALGFVWDPLVAAFENGLAALAQYMEREGHDRVPSKWVEELNGEDFKLGGWVTKLRNKKRGGRVPAERVEALDALGFDWDPNETSYQRRFAALAQYMEREGHDRVPQGHKGVFDGEEVELLKFINQVRSARRRGGLSDDKFAALDALGLDWDPLETAFQRGLAALAQFVAREGHPRPPQSCTEEIDGESFRLGNWLSNQRVKFKADKMSEDRKKALDAFDGWL